MGRKAKMVSLDLPLETLGLDVRKHYKRLTAQADEMYRKSRWQVEPGGPKESPALYALTLAVNSISTQVRRTHYKRWCDSMESLLDEYKAATGFATSLEDITEEQLASILNVVKNPDTLKKLAKESREVYGRSHEVAFLYRRFESDIDPSLSKPKKPKEDKK